MYMTTHMYLHTACTCMPTCACTHMYTHMCFTPHVHTCLHMHTYHMCMPICACTHACTCTHITYHMYIPTCACTYKHRYIPHAHEGRGRKKGREGRRNSPFPAQPPPHAQSNQQFQTCSRSCSESSSRIPKPWLVPSPVCCLPAPDLDFWLWLELGLSPLGFCSARNLYEPPVNGDCIPQALSTLTSESTTTAWPVT